MVCLNVWPITCLDVGLLAVTLRDCDSFFEVRFVFVLVIAAGATISESVPLSCDV